MRLPLLALCGVFAASTLLGCGGATIPAPPSSVKDGPPPGTSGEMTEMPKKAEIKKKK